MTARSPEAFIVARPRSFERSRRPITLWLPTTLLLLALAPLALAATPFLYLARRRVLPDPFGLVLGVGRLLLSTSGTVVQVSRPGADLNFRLF